MAITTLLAEDVTHHPIQLPTKLAGLTYIVG